MEAQGGSFWEYEMNRCVSCMKKENCPDRALIRATLRQMTVDLEKNQGGASSGLVVVVCRDKNLG